MPRPKMTPMDYIVSALKRNPRVPYADIKSGADKRGLTIYPIMFGRAQLLLGIVKKGGGSGGGAGNGRRGARRGPGRPAGSGRRGRPAVNGTGALDALMSSIRDQGKESSQLRLALARIRAIIDDAL